MLSIRPSAACSVAVTSVFAALLKPMWLSLICTKLKSPGFPACVFSPKTRDTGTPPARVQISPVPAHAIHCRNPRRSIPSRLISLCCSSSLGSLGSLLLFLPLMFCFLADTEVSAEEN